MLGEYVVHSHRIPRISLFVPTESGEAPPIPCDRIDVMRATHINRENVDDMRTEDCWSGASSSDHHPSLLGGPVKPG